MFYVIIRYLILMENNRIMKIGGIIIILSLVTVIGFFMQEPQENNFDTIIDSSENYEDCVNSSKRSESGLDNSSGIVQHGNVTVYFIDAGVGDSIFIDTSDKDVLIDAGEKKDGVAITMFLVGLNVTEIDYLVASHPHFDHIGGFIPIMQFFSSLNMSMGTVIENGQDRDTELFDEYRSYAEKIGITLAERCQIFQLDSETEMIILSPPQPLLFSNHNENSMVMLIRYKEVSFLLTGDIEENSEKELVDSGLSLEATIMKVGHHGARTSAIDSFLSEVNPEVSVITVGAENQNGHPHSDTIERLVTFGSDVYRTDLHGTISITTNGINYSVSTEKIP